MGDGRSHSLVVTRRPRVGGRFDSWDPSHIGAGCEGLTHKLRGTEETP
jgi:hypothetical protein